MPAYEREVENGSDIVKAFSIAFVGLCRALEQQHKIMPDSIAQAIHAEMAELPSGASPYTEAVKTMVTNLAKAVNGAPIAKGRTSPSIR